MTDQLEQNIRGVFLDLADGGITENEAITQIRDLVGVEEAPTRIVFSYLLRATVIVDIADEEVVVFEIEPREAERTDHPETREDGNVIDPIKYHREIKMALDLAQTLDWPSPTVVS